MNTQNKEIFKRWAVDFYFSDKEREAIENLSEEKIVELAKKINIKIFFFIRPQQIYKI